MSSEKKYFICRNDQCNPDRVDGGVIFQYDPVAEGEKFQCNHCKSEYKEEKGTVFYIAKGNEDGETIFESYSEFFDFRGQFDDNRIHFKKLIFRNIHEIDFQGRVLSFSNCIIDELFIENTKITSAYYPISFFDCSIENIRISNSSIKESKGKDYKSLWSFYGINLFQTEVTESFTIDGLETRLMISECKIDCPIIFSGKSKVDLALANNKRDPEIKVDKSSAVKDLFMVAGRNANMSTKKITTKGKTIKESRIEALYIDADIETQTTIEDCYISKLIFGEAENIKGKLLFNNCIIDNIQNEPYCFEKDLVFINCTFKNELVFSRARCRQSIILEACSFKKQAIFNDLKIEEDLQLNYSEFKQGLNISGNHCMGYIKSNFISIGGGLKVAENVVGREVIFRCISVTNKIELNNNQITGYLFLRQVRAYSNLEVNWLDANELDIDDMLIKGILEINSSNLKSNLRVKALRVDGKSDLSSISLHGDILISRSSFREDIMIVFCESKINMFTMNDFGSDFNYLYSTITKLTHIKDNLSRSSFSINTLESHNISFENNQVLTSISISDTKANEFEITKNQIHDGFTLDNAAISDLKIKQNEFLENVRLEYCTIHKNISFEGNLVQKLSLTDMKANKVNFYWNNIYNGLETNYLKFNHIDFTNNIIAEGFSFKNGEVLNNIEFSRNEFFGDFEINILEGNDIFINYNIFWQNIGIYNIEIDDLFFKCNSSGDFKIINGSYASIEIDECEEIGKLNFNSITARKDITVDKNNFVEGLEFWLCSINNELKIEHNTAPKYVKIDRTQSDFLVFTDNKTDKFSVGMGKYRQFKVSENKEIGEAIFNYFTIENDITLTDNIFLKAFILKFCRIENDFEFNSNSFNEGIGLYKNTIHGSINQNDKLIKGYFTLQENFVENDIILETKKFEASLLIEENNVEQKCKISNATFNTKWDLEIKNNRFNDFTIENTFIDTFLYFDNNVVNGNLRFGKHVLAQEDKVIKFSKAVSIADNKIRNGMFYNLVFELPVCLHSNNFDGDLTFHDTVHKKAMDFTGSFVGGSFIFKKTEAENYDGDLILDNIFIDKRIAFYNSFPYTFSYKNATFNGFEIPQNWKMHKKKLINTFYRDQDAIKFKKISNFTELKRWLIRVIYGGRKLYIFRENNLRKTQHEDADLPYNLIKSQYEADPYLNKLPALWKEIQFEIIPDEKKKKILTEVIEHGENIITGSNYFNECINKSFLPVYYGFYNKDVLEALSGLTEHFLEAENNSEDEEVSQIFNLLKEFCKRFHYTLWYFNNHKVLWGAGEVKKDQQLFKKKLNESLEEQYRVLRQIYRNEGELTNEDWAYYKWMHYKNLAEANSASFKQKLKSWGKYLIFEKTFGWGVDLLVILRSTGWIILLFAAIYNVMFLINPELSIQWDEQSYTPGFILSCVLALQTTFSAVLGDWAPIGSGSIKIPMTINAVMGVFFVTFMIGAYGRKMLR